MELNNIKLHEAMTFTGVKNKQGKQTAIGFDGKEYQIECRGPFDIHVYLEDKHIAWVDPSDGRIKEDR